MNGFVNAHHESRSAPRYLTGGNGTHVSDQYLKKAHAANQFFVGNAQLLKRLETVEKSLVHNAKIVVPANCELVNIIGELAGAPSGKNGSLEEGVSVGDKVVKRLLGTLHHSPATALQ